MNPYSKKQGVFVRENAGSFGYSDGDDVENNLLELLRGVSDKSLYSEELASKITDWTTLYYFSQQRSALLVPFVKLIRGKKVLEIGCGLGAVTRAFAEFGADVTAMDGSFRRVSIAAERCRDFPDVKFYCDNFSDFELDEKFDLVTLIGVLEYAPLFVKAEHPFEAMLRKAKSFLKPDGHLMIAIENRLGIKYFNNMPEDHVNTPFFGIQDLYENGSVHTYGKKELSEILKAAGFDKFTFHYPFPDYKFPTMYLHPAAFSTPELNVPDLLARNMAHHQGCGDCLFYEDLAVDSLCKNGLLEDFANSFVILTGDPEEPVKNLCATRITPNRKKATASVVQIVKNDHGLSVFRSSASDFFNGNGSADFRKESPYHTGELLSMKILKFLAAHHCSLEDLVKLFSPWADFLKSHRIDGTETLPSVFLDCTPFNLIVQGSEFVFFDQEDGLKKDPVSIAHVIFRGILYTFTETPFLNLTPDLPRNVMDLTKKIADALGFRIEIDDFLALEYEIQKEIARSGSFEKYRGSCRDISSKRQINDELARVTKELEGFLTSYYRVCGKIYRIYIRLFPLNSIQRRIVSRIIRSLLGH